MLNLTTYGVPGTEEPSDTARLRNLLTLDNEYPAFTDEGRAEYVRIRVAAIITHFVIPVVAEAIRNRYEMVQALETPGAWSDVEAMNWGRMPQPQFAIGGFGPIDRALAARIKEVGGQPYEPVRFGDMVVFEPM